MRTTEWSGSKPRKHRNQKKAYFDTSNRLVTVKAPRIQKPKKQYISSKSVQDPQMKEPERPHIDSDAAGWDHILEMPELEELLRIDD